MGVTVTKEAGARTGGSGSYVLRVTGTSPFPEYVYAQHSLVLTAGKEYRIKGWLRCDPTNAFDPFIRTERVDAGGPGATIVAPGGTIAWYGEFDETFTPTHDSYLRFGGVNGGTVVDYWFEFDDITLWATEDEPSDPLLYWTAGGDAILAKDLVTVFEGEQSLSVTGKAGGDYSRQDVNLDERYSGTLDAFAMFDSGNGIIQSRVLDPFPAS